MACVAFGASLQVGTAAQGSSLQKQAATLRRSASALTTRRAGLAATLSQRVGRGTCRSRGGLAVCQVSVATVEGEPPKQDLNIPDLPPKKVVYSHIGEFASPDGVAATLELASTFLVLAGTYAGALASFAQFSCGNHLLGAAGSVAFCLLCGLTKMRLFIQFHDMAHGSFFPNRNPVGCFANKVLGAITGAMTFTSLTRWNRIHNKHHAISNNLDENQHAQTAPWSVRQYYESDPKEANLFRFKYNPYVQWILGPFVVFFIVNRKCPWNENLLWAANLATLGFIGGLPLLLFECVEAYLAGFAGMYLFHAQHTFDGVYKRRTEDWDFYANGLLGSSYIQIPEALKWFSCGIEYHHIHHLNVAVPSYKIRECHEAAEELWEEVPKFGLEAIPGTMKYGVWDERTQDFLSTPELEPRRVEGQ
mmetsp:Transcript_11061/g.40508  ORF Transcript_11061/g.40508 Transcript_11061/m.40508 type:complete len:420 (+) Transcript_11061:86-1345(+)